MIPVLSIRLLGNIDKYPPIKTPSIVPVLCAVGRVFYSTVELILFSAHACNGKKTK